MKVRMTLRQARKNAGMTQEELAELVGIDRAFYSNIERGKHTPSLSVAYKIARVLKSSIETLFFKDDVRKTNKKKNPA
jgi:putative transcriptional regulator